MRLTKLGAGGLALACLLGCASKPITDDATGGSGADNGGTASGGTPASVQSKCTSALRESLALVDEVATADVTLLDQTAGELVIYVDASAGGINGSDTHPWVYLSLKDGAKVAVTDLDALHSLDWDIAFKRYIIRTNGGDSGPGHGGAIRVTLPWEQVDSSTLGGAAVPAEQWFDSDCKLVLDTNDELVTTFSDWSEYNQSLHILTPADAVFITASADGTLYRVQILDYYSTPTGAHGTTDLAGHYKLRIAPLP